VNWFGPNQNLATTVVARVNPANGQITVRNGYSAAASAPTHFIFDAVGYIA
jgi:hypothetical protein